MPAKKGQMMITNEAVEALHQMFKDMRGEVKKEVEYAMESYRRGVVTKGKWCCQDMRELAQDLWGLSSPKEDKTTFYPQLMFKNKYVNYCPFCGVKL